MNTSKIILFAIIFLAACGKSEKNRPEQKADISDNPNQALYEQVMDVHDEVMPKNGQLYQLKRELQEKMKATDLSDDTKKQLGEIIHELDSADKAMMNWMHRFSPLPDTANREAAREYLEDEMEKIKKVRDLTEGVLQKAKDKLGKK
ncbi:MAG: hypothetical protein OJF59_000363 [Cytophagales bacterium]|jgi:septation ring formation regulator EzrA|nr:hypothetical protein [Bacteroidota bacterium]MBS1981153.1 hypothetical protein [Bacteroidota bacterium]WHZ06610.1 MAG: hypothetical protein OJF59_000363 [Cytophagales bacterium]